MSSPTARSLDRLRKMGYRAQVVEHWNPFAKRRVDLFGFIDVLAIREGEILGVQATTMDNRSKRVEKIRTHESVPAWLSAGGLLEVWAWRRLKVKRGGKAFRWELERLAILPDAVSCTGAVVSPM